ncbi:MAG: carboxypeptidase-like regulatory domain-containing protein [Bacteroidales bacterium]|nr:carboxypeptidase-like regulatory domain-containing protein [Bacteroidales bacterium]
MRQMICAILILWVLAGAGVPLHAQVCEGIVVSGVVKDAKSKKPVANANVGVDGHNIGTITNADGAFSLTVPDSLANEAIVISMLGYSNASLPIAKAAGQSAIMLERASMLLGEMIVYWGNPDDIIRQALRKIPNNYPQTRDRLSVFYRETIQKGKKYTEVSEAIMGVSKSAYRMRTPGNDRAQVLKARKIMSQNASDTLAVKITGGPNLSIMLDFVKNPDFFLSETELDAYELKMEPMVEFDGRPQYAISIKPVQKLSYPLMQGIVYVDAQELAFTRAELDLDLSDKALAVKTILRKKPAGLRFSLQKVGFTVAYRQGSDGMTYLSYIKNEMRFKCDWKRRLFASGYTAVAEMVTVDREVGVADNISRSDAFRSNDAFSDKALLFWDPDFWKGYNIIEPTESLEKAISRLRK